MVIRREGGAEVVRDCCFVYIYGDFEGMFDGIYAYWSSTVS